MTVDPCETIPLLGAACFVTLAKALDKPTLEAVSHFGMLHGDYFRMRRGVSGAKSLVPLDPKGLRHC
jgi:hypothetical protein